MRLDELKFPLLVRTVSTVYCAEGSIIQCGSLVLLLGATVTPNEEYGCGFMMLTETGTLKRGSGFPRRISVWFEEVTQGNCRVK